LTLGRAGKRERKEAAMSIRIVRLGDPRNADEGLRIGTVRRPPRGVPKAEIASRNFYDVWLPDLAPSEALLKRIKPADVEQHWRAFTRSYRLEMKQPAQRRLLELLAALSQRTNFPVGCYCADESHCHRSILSELLVERGARCV
jgi:uncharacterized protein YeaO (DUF488 family)